MQRYKICCRFFFNFRMIILRILRSHCIWNSEWILNKITYAEHNLTIAQLIYVKTNCFYSWTIRKVFRFQQQKISLNIIIFGNLIALVNSVNSYWNFSKLQEIDSCLVKLIKHFCDTLVDFIINNWAKNCEKSLFNTNKVRKHHPETKNYCVRDTTIKNSPKFEFFIILQKIIYAYKKKQE